MEKQNRILPIMSLELSARILKLEEELEKVINSDLDVEVRIKKMIRILDKIVLAELSIEKFRVMTTPENPDNNKQ